MKTKLYVLDEDNIDNIGLAMIVRDDLDKTDLNPRAGPNRLSEAKSRGVGMSLKMKDFKHGCVPT